MVTVLFESLGVKDENSTVFRDMNVWFFYGIAG